MDWIFRAAERRKPERGINIVDLMIWIIIAGLLLALAVQGLGRYWTASVVYLMKNDLNTVVSVAHTEAIGTNGVGPDEIGRAVAESAKSPGVTISWGMATYTGSSSQPVALGGAPRLELASMVQRLPGSRPATTSSTPQTSYVLVAEHPGAPNIVVLYFFDTVGPFVSGSSIIVSENEIPTVTGGDYSPPPTTTATPTPTTSPQSASGTGTSASASSSTASAAPTPVPTATAAPTAPSASGASASPSSSFDAPTASPSPSLSASGVTSSPATVPAPAPAATTTSTTSSTDKDKTKYPLCHRGVMLELPYTAIANGFSGQGVGHENDIIPPIPDYSYPGRNWNATTEPVFNNNCQPVS